ncbi:MAG: universal stress protein [Burkholderiales bacterium]|nr:universal stress protein [Burkholderiales bacterium]
MKILIAADGSPYTKRALAYLAAHEEWLGTHHAYTVIHVAAAIPHRAAAFLAREQVKSFYEDDAEVVFKPIRAFFAMHGIKAKFVLRIGDAGMNIAKHGERGRFDLILMGSHGHGAAVALVMGSVATRVLSQCSTPVLLIR